MNRSQFEIKLTFRVETLHALWAALVLGGRLLLLTVQFGEHFVQRLAEARVQQLDRFAVRQAIDRVAFELLGHVLLPEAVIAGELASSQPSDCRPSGRMDRWRDGGVWEQTTRYGNGRTGLRSGDEEIDRSVNCSQLWAGRCSGWCTMIDDSRRWRDR